MTPGGGLRFEEFLLDPADRQLRRNDAPVELNGRYFDALALLVQEQGKLVSKSRLLEVVWRGVPVTDEAVTQCIKTLRRQLGDNAANPRFIQTVPKHGYRFIAPVERVGLEADDSAQPAAGPEQKLLPPDSWRHFLVLGGSGTLGGGAAGMLGGLLYGFAVASHSLQPGMGAVSMLLVLVCLTILVAVIGGAGVAFGIAAARFASVRPWPWQVLGGAAGGLLVGAFVKLIGLDAFNLLFGQSPGDITGAVEGALLGAAVGVGALSADDRARTLSLRRTVAAAGLAGGAAGFIIPLLGGRLMGGSLDLLVRSFPDSRLQLDQIGALFGENGFGPISQVVTGCLEGMLFGGCIVSAMVIAQRNLNGKRSADRQLRRCQ